ncbi:hypothetical protein LOD99_9036 [Oopsacas minuta]|uniref:Uncharacterized protein n=1 Tax=Oopsacas minuta TaxID=111878 RepID=A0AAV7JDT2_9METZ|nr:hypothetical protein LOD99_9036 [Oopsacas minuta]
MFSESEKLSTSTTACIKFSFCCNAKLGMYTFCIHGVVHHLIDRLIPEVGEPPKFAQIYIHEGTPDAELENLQRYLGVTCRPELKRLKQMLHYANPYVSCFRHAIDHMRNMNTMDIHLTILECGIGDPRTALPTLF